MGCTVWRIPVASDSPTIERMECDAESISDADGVLPKGGIYGAFSTAHGQRVIGLSRHLDRLEDSARRMGFSLSIDRVALGQALRRASERSGYEEVKIRIGTARGLDHFVVAMERSPGVLTRERENGVTCTTVRHTARSNPRAKQIGWLSTRKSFARSQSTTAYEYLLVDDDDLILEGSSSNFYAVLGDPPTLRTAGDGVLGGIARSIVLEIAPPIVPVDLSSICRSQLPDLSEAFLTSATRGIIPVVEVDGHPIGSGRPGPITSALMLRYDERARELEEPL